MNVSTLMARLEHHFSGLKVVCTQEHDEITMVLGTNDLVGACYTLLHTEEFGFDQLMDITAVDYLHYGLSEWETDGSTSTGFERAVQPLASQASIYPHERFAVVYHLLSTKHNHRLRIKVRLAEDALLIDTVTSLWASANWYEREVFDLFGILFKGHPDLRRILTDYGFVGHPFRKDFPLIGEVAMRYDAHLGRVVYEPVDIKERVLVPKTLRRTRPLPDKTS